MDYARAFVKAIPGEDKIAGFYIFWGDIDVKWLPEACQRKSGFYTVRHFVEGGTMPGAGVLNIIRGACDLALFDKSGDVKQQAMSERAFE